MGTHDFDGITVGAGMTLTQASTPAEALPPGSGTSGARFVPGTVIGGRYRLVALLGRGGMGEVYRADDLMLDQTVALKFLPGHLAREAHHLAHLYNELRTARQIAHKNVCRLYDLGEAQGDRFLTMEYVDGENLASLLRRVGRFPQDRAIAIARQLCAGVAAAHDRGILHRDLKPANVMIDGNGDVRITDFGIAASLGDASVEAAGTPQYMAPEQLNGQPASIRTDIYALGLILFEVFTGGRVHDARTIDELKALHETGTTPTPTSLVHDLDLAVERVIVRCLERDPERRPASALAVAAALPGADPLREALAAGETPSPALLVAAAEAEALSVPRALAAAGWSIAALVIAAMLAPSVTLARLVPLPRAPEVLADRAEQILASFGDSQPRGDAAEGFIAQYDVLNWIGLNDTSPQRWRALSTGSPPALLYWYRTSPRYLVPRPLALRVTPADPPSVDTGMQTVVLDTRGRLVQFAAVPPQFDPADAPSTALPAWDAMFAAAGLDRAAFSPVTPQWSPRDFADTRAAWEGTLSDSPAVNVRIEAATFQGRPISFAVIGPWTRPVRMQPPRRAPFDAAMYVVVMAIGLALIAGAAVLARHNIRTRRDDRRSATRVAVAAPLASFSAWVIANHHVPDVQAELASLYAVIADGVLFGAVLWILYVAVEPYCRRFWPDMLLGWTRLLSGRIRDARVGRDILVGVGFGTAWLLLEIGRYTMPTVLGYPPAAPRLGSDASALLGPADTLLTWVVTTFRQLNTVLIIVLMLVVLRLMTRQAWAAIAIGMAMVFVWWSNFGSAPAFWLELVFEIAALALFTFVLVRFGVLAAAVTLIVAKTTALMPLTLDVGHWSATPSLMTIVAVSLLVMFGYYAARQGQPLFGRLD